MFQTFGGILEMNKTSSRGDVSVVEILVVWMVGLLVGWFYSTSIFIGYLTPNPFL